MSGPVGGRGLSGVAARNPARLVLAGFVVAVLVGAALLSVPGATVQGERAPVLTALFTATSAVCVTGLVVVDTGTYWSGFGQGVVGVLIQLGGLGLMTVSSVLVILVGRRLGPTRTLLARTEHATVAPSDVRRVTLGVLVFSLVFEALLALALLPSMLARRGTDLVGGTGDAVWRAVFHALSAFNNAGFDLFTTSLAGFTRAPEVLLPVSAAVVLGGLGFPVLVEVVRARGRGARSWSLHTRLTLAATAALLVLGAVGFAVNEWSNPATLGALPVEHRPANVVVGTVMPRTAGFSSVDYGEATGGTQLFTMALMFIGAGSASTAGGIKVTTWVVVGLLVWAEVRGDDSVGVFGRRLPPQVPRQALTVVVVGLTALLTGAFLLVEVTGLPLSDALFEATSAFGTVGLSTGVTGDLDTVGRLVVVGLMLAGRVGPVTLVVALALRGERRRYRLAAERPLLG